MDMETSPVTERANPLTKDIDNISVAEAIDCLRKCDNEILDGFEKFASVYDKFIQQEISKISEQLSIFLNLTTKKLVLFSGCGTSGRLGYLTAKTLKEAFYISHAGSIDFDYLIAGGDLSLVSSQEAPEDDANAGIADLVKVSEQYTRVIFFGITCGLSAPYVCGQLDYCLNNTSKYFPVLLGFNPPSLARDSKIPGFYSSFLDVVNVMRTVSAEGKASLITPVIGPEPITGSSRMKGGTATLLILYSMFSTLQKCSDQNSECFRNSFVKNLNQLRDILSFISPYNALLEEIISCCVPARSVFYLGTGDLGYLGIVDASECVPTFSAHVDDVRGFLPDGYLKTKNKEGNLASFPVDLDTMTNLATVNDVVVVFSSEHFPINPAIEQCVSDMKSCSNLTIKRVDLPKLSTPSNLMPEICIEQLAVKLLLNAISTILFIKRGKVYRNIMVDVRVSNIKLFHRSVQIIESLTSVSGHRAFRSLIASIWEINLEHVSNNYMDRAVYDHILQCGETGLSGVVPVAIVIAKSGISYKLARNFLCEHKTVRKTLQACLHKP